MGEAQRARLDQLARVIPLRQGFGGEVPGAEAATFYSTMAHQITGEGGANLGPGVHGNIVAEAGADLAPAVHGVIVAEAGADLAPVVHGVIVAESGTDAGAQGMRISGELTPEEAVGFLEEAGVFGGRPYYVTRGFPELLFEEDTFAPDGAVPAGWFRTIYWSNLDEPWCLELWEDGVVDNAAWYSESDVATPDLASGWTTTGAGIGTPVVAADTEVLTPAQITTEGGADLEPAVHGQIVPEN